MSIVLTSGAEFEDEEDIRDYLCKKYGLIKER